MRTTTFLTLFLGFFLFACSEQETNVEKLSFLHTEGQYIFNEENDTIYLEGVGLGNWLLPEGYMWKFGNEADRPRKIEKLILELMTSLTQ